ncbi:MAG: transglutaminase-like domain-containing protein [Burkholderiales bacterium]|nr:transglutaminase-like domain-containing protein [Burkholderiales bacterium]
MPVKTPPFLVALGLVFWGWAAGLLLPALALALVIESPRIAKARWSFDGKDFERVADLCSIAFLVLMAWQWFGSRNGPAGLVVVLTWLPIVFIAILLMQRFDARNATPLSALFWSLRRRRANTPPRSLPLDYPFFCLCLVSAACANQRSMWFFGGLVLLAVYALYPLRAEGRRFGTWGVALGLALGLAYLLQIGILQAQEQVESFVMEYLRDRVFGRSDPFRAHTAIGDVGRVKLSDRILFRVAGAKTLPLKLRDGTFNVYAHDSWFAQGSNFRPVPPEGASSWVIGEGVGPSMQISTWLMRGRAMLPLPPGTFRLDGLNVGRVEANSFGSVRVSEGPDLVLFSVRSDLARERDAGPEPADLQVPKRIEAALMQVLTEAGGQGLPPAGVARTLQRFFQERFAYTLKLDAREGGRRTLERFLLDDRRGHCEYFASAATLLLRAAGVPARYATGYVVEEWSPLERQFVVRARHAHAWTLAWIDGRWREVDATPVGWFAAEAEAEPAWRPAADFFSWLGFAFQRWRVSGDESDEGMSPYWLLAIIPLAAWVAWRVTRRNRVKLQAATASPDAAAGPSPIEPLLERLEALGFRRPAAAPVRPWLQSLPLSPALQSAATAVAHNYARWRFDPATTEPSADSLRTQATDLAQRIEAEAADASRDPSSRHGAPAV